MNQNKSNPSKRFLQVCKITVPVFLALAVLTAAGFFLAMRNDFEPEIGHFTVGSAPYTLTIIAVIAAVILGCILLLLSKRSASIIKDIDENPVTVFGSILAALMSIACLFSSAADLTLGAGLSKPALISSFLTPFIGVSMVLAIFKELRNTPLRQICAIAAAVCVNISMFADYFDFTLPLNSPVRNLVTITKGAALLYLLSEARISFSQKSGRITLPFAVFTTGLTASVVLGYTCGAILASVAAPLASNPNPPIFQLALYAAIGVHAAGRLFTLIPAVGEYIEPPKEEKKKKK